MASLLWEFLFKKFGPNDRSIYNWFYFPFQIAQFKATTKTWLHSQPLLIKWSAMRTLSSSPLLLILNHFLPLRWNRVNQFIEYQIQNQCRSHQRNQNKNSFSFWQERRSPPSSWQDFPSQQRHQNGRRGRHCIPSPSAMSTLSSSPLLFFMIHSSTSTSLQLSFGRSLW